MSEKTDEKEPDETVERRFNETLKRLANTPHRPHKPKQKESQPKD